LGCNTENKKGYILCGSLLVKDFTRLKEIQKPVVAWGLDVGRVVAEPV